MFALTFPLQIAWYAAEAIYCGISRLLFVSAIILMFTFTIPFQIAWYAVEAIHCGITCFCS